MPLHLNSSIPKRIFFYRVWGTIGWIVAGLLVGWMAWGGKDLGNTFLYAGVTSGLLGVFSFFYQIHRHPNKVPNSCECKEIFGLDSLKLLLNKRIISCILFIASMLICIPLAFYYSNARAFCKEILKVKECSRLYELLDKVQKHFMFFNALVFARFNVKKCCCWYAGLDVALSVLVLPEAIPVLFGDTGHRFPRYMLWFLFVTGHLYRPGWRVKNTFCRTRHDYWQPMV